MIDDLALRVRRQNVLAGRLEKFRPRTLSRYFNRGSTLTTRGRDRYQNE